MNDNTNLDRRHKIELFFELKKKLSITNIILINTTLIFSQKTIKR